MKRKPRSLDFAYATKSFVGYLEGTEKSLHTIKNYRSDLLSFQKFLEEGLGADPVAITKVRREDLDRFHDYLKAQNLKANTRRRKLLTIRKLMRYLSQRKQIPLNIADRLPAPGKVERIPLTVAYSDLVARIRALPTDTLLFHRNQVLLWALAETGCQVSEVTRLRFENWKRLEGGSGRLSLGGKADRALSVSSALLDAVESLRTRASGSRENPWLFLGFNKFGSLGAPMTPRGVELLVRSYADKLGVPELTPRTFRHSVVLHWLEEGVDREEIRKRLGLKTDYAFRVYDALWSARQSEAGAG